MNSKVRSRLARLNSDYESITGSKYKHFYCPVLFKDENTNLCQAHIINKAFKDSDRTWTVQRKDVDSFYGSHFEAEFETIQEKGRYKADEVLASKTLSKKLKPKMYADGKRVEYYRPSSTIPTAHTPVALADFSESTKIALKLSQEKMETESTQNWEIRIENDLRLPSLVSLLKAAHLTLFHLRGYRHPLSMGGHFVGKTILGDFYLRARGMSKNDVTELAFNHFNQFANMVRPALINPRNLKGTLTDRCLYVWMYRDEPWALVVLVRTGDLLNSVAMPVMRSDEDSARFIRFLQEQGTTTEAKFAKWKGDSLVISPNSETQVWPPSQFDPKKAEVKSQNGTNEVHG